MVVYLDTSALVKLYVEEEDRELVVAAVEERFEDLRFLAFDARLIDAAKAASVAVYGHETNAEQEVDG